MATATFAIIHTATRVIRRVTTDLDPVVAADESVVPLGATVVDFKQGPLTIDPGGKVGAASAQAIDDADVDETKVQAKAIAARDALVAAFKDVQDDAAVPKSVQIALGLLAARF